MNFKKIDFQDYPDAFSVDGHNCFTLIYDSKYAQGFRGYKSIQMDLEFCVQLIDFLKDNQNDNFSAVTWASTLSLIVTYARCFTASKGFRAKLEGSAVPKAHRDHHQKIMQLRHQYVAHAGGGGEGSVNFLALYPNHDRKRVVAVAPPLPVRLTGLNEATREGLRAIISDLLTLVKQKQNQCMNKVMEEIKKQDLEKLYSYFDGEEGYTPDIGPSFAGRIQHTMDQHGGFYVKLVR